MKLEKLQSIVKDEGLQRVLWGSTGAAGGKQEVEQGQLVENLFSSTNKEDITRLVGILTSSSTSKGTCKKLLAKIEKYAASRGEKSGLSKEQIDQIVASCASKKSKSKEVDLPPQASALIETVHLVGQAAPSDVAGTSSSAPPPAAAAGPIQYDQFPEEQRTFEELSKRAAELKEHQEIGQRIIDEIKRRVKEDPAITSLSTSVAKTMAIASKHNAPYDLYRAGREIEGAYFNGSEVNTDLQNFILMGCPKGPKDTGDFFDTAIQQKVRVIVSLNDDGEANSRYHNFWENERLCTLVLRDGWTIQKVSERILDQKPSEIPGGRDPRIVESTLIATKGDEKREITHFHYAGWHDKSPMPSEELLSTLYDRIEEINKKEGITPQTPIVANCKGGVGRTGSFAVGWYARRHIDKRLAEGKDDAMNMPEIIYREFRRRRSGIIGRPSQLAQVYSVTAKYYRRKQGKVETK